MPGGRPPIAQDTLVSFMESKPDRVLDLKLDEPQLQRLAMRRVGHQINLRKAVEQLRLNGRLHSLQAGRYAFTESPARSPRLMDLDPVAEALLRRLEIPYYLSWHSALWHYGLVDQQSRRIYVAVTRRKRPAKVGNGVIQFIHISDEDKFFGGRTETDYEWPVDVAGPEKAILDSLDRPRYALSVPIVANALRRGHADGVIDSQQLVSDALHFNSPHLNRRLGFFMELYGILGADELALRLGRGYAISLDPGRHYKQGPKPPVNQRWRVFEDPGIVGTAEELK